MYVRPEKVTAPAKKWQLDRVVIPGERGPNSAAWAIGYWRDEANKARRRIAMRWNGSKDKPLGNPASHGAATWFMLDEKAHEQLLNYFESVVDEPAMTYIRTFFNAA